MDRDEPDNPELDEVIEEAAADLEPEQRVARRELEQQADDDDAAPQDGLQM